MPEFEVTLRYRQEWTASIIVQAKNEQAAEELVENQFDKVNSYTSFEAFVESDSTPQLDVEELEIERVDAL